MLAIANIPASASTGNASTGANASVQSAMKVRYGHWGADGLLSKLVEDGTISQSTLDAINAYMQSNEKQESQNRAAKQTATFADLVSHGLITQAEADAMQAYVSANKGDMQARAKGSPFDNLVKQGVITQAKADAIQQYLEANRPQKSTKNGTDKAATNGKGDLLAQLVTAGVITQADADAIQAAQPQKAADGTMKGLKSKGNPFANLVEQGVITQAKADAIQQYLEANRPQKSTKNGTDKAAAVKGKGDLLTQLVTAGVITQADADAIQAAQPQTCQDGKRQGCNMFQIFVDNNIITQEKADAINAYLKSKADTAQTGAAKGKTNIFADMLSAGVITQAEYDAITAKLADQPQRGNLPQTGVKFQRGGMGKSGKTTTA